jgi:hypothetical protein
MICAFTLVRYDVIALVTFGVANHYVQLNIVIGHVQGV